MELLIQRAKEETKKPLNIIFENHNYDTQARKQTKNPFQYVMIWSILIIRNNSKFVKLKVLN